MSQNPVHKILIENSGKRKICLTDKLKALHVNVSAAHLRRRRPRWSSIPSKDCGVRRNMGYFLGALIETPKCILVWTRLSKAKKGEPSNCGPKVIHITFDQRCPPRSTIYCWSERVWRLQRGISLKVRQAIRTKHPELHDNPGAYRKREVLEASESWNWETALQTAMFSFSEDQEIHARTPVRSVPR